MFVQSSNKITLSVTTNPSIMENIKEKNVFIFHNYIYFLNVLLFVYVEW